MIERMAARFKGCISYENGIRTTRLASFITDGTTFTTTIFDIPHEPCPILATLKNQKNNIPYEDEIPLHFEISYKNQDDITHTAYCEIPIYAEKDLDFRINMEEPNDFVKEILSIAPRTGYTDYKGDLNDVVEIIALEGNIIKIQAAISIIFSEALYQIRAVSIQKFVETAYSGGLRRLAQDFGLNLGSTFTEIELRLFTRIFSTFVVPSKSFMQETMSTIFKVLDPTGYVEVIPEYSDSYYRMLVDIYTTITDFTENNIKILLLFAERYRPVPATNLITVIFPVLFDIDLARDEGSVEITEAIITMSTVTFMSSTTYMGAGNIIEPDLPTTYP